MLTVYRPRDIFRMQFDGWHHAATNLKKIGEKAFFKSGAVNVSFSTDACPSLPESDVFPNIDRLRICFPALGFNDYANALGYILEGKNRFHLQTA